MQRRSSKIPQENGTSHNNYHSSLRALPTEEVSPPEPGNIPRDPSRLTRQQILDLHQIIGNRAVQRLLDKARPVERQSPDRFKPGLARPNSTVIGGAQANAGLREKPAPRIIHTNLIQRSKKWQGKRRRVIAQKEHRLALEVEARQGLQTKAGRLQTRDVQEQAEYLATLQRNKEQRLKVKQVIEQAARIKTPQNEKERRLRNSAQWIKKNVGEVKLFVLTKTHDSHIRVKAQTEEVRKKFISLNVGRKFLEDTRKDLDEAVKKPSPDEEQIKDLTETIKNDTLKIKKLEREINDLLNSAKASKEAAYFPYPKGALYPDETAEAKYEFRLNLPAKESNVEVGSPTEAGWTLGGNIALVFDNLENGESDIQLTLMHEVQHIADRHEKEEEDSDPDDPSFEDALTKFITEFRAYYYSGEFKKVRPPAGHSQEAYRRFKIREKIKEQYPYVKNAWEKNLPNPRPREGFSTFREAVVQYTDQGPESVNPDNSWRIHKFYDTLYEIRGEEDLNKLECFWGRDEEKPEYKLEKEEAKIVLESDIWKRFAKRFSSK